MENDKVKLAAFEVELKEKESEVTTSRAELEEVEKRLESINSQMRDCDVEGSFEPTAPLDSALRDADDAGSETARSARKSELLENMKRIFPGQVVGRLVELCQPIHSRYKLAVTKVLG